MVTILGHVGGIADDTPSGTGGYAGGHKLECIPNEISTVDVANPTSSGPHLKLAKVNLRGITPRENSNTWKQTDGAYMPCAKCTLPSSDVVRQ